MGVLAMELEYRGTRPHPFQGWSAGALIKMNFNLSKTKMRKRMTVEFEMTPDAASDCVSDSG